MSNRKSNLKGAGPGRPQGSKNKISSDIAQAFKKTFDDLGGTEGFTKWAEQPQNKGKFYNMTTKLLPKPEPVVNVGVGITQGITMQEMIDYHSSPEGRRERKEQELERLIHSAEMDERTGKEYRTRMMRLRATGFDGCLKISNGGPQYEEGWEEGKYSDEWDQIVKEEKVKKQEEHSK